MAKTEATLAGFDEAIMLTQAGDVSEGSGENLFLINGNSIITPLVGDNNLTGITRDSVITIAKRELNIDIQERSIRRSELYLADEIFLTGTAAHVTPVGELDNRKISDGNVGPITRQIQEIYLEAIRGGLDEYLHWCTPVKV